MCFSCKSSNLYKFKKLFIHNLFSRIKIVNFLQFNFSSLEIFQKIYSRDLNFYLIFSLRKSFLHTIFFSKYFAKRNGSFIFFLIWDFYNFSQEFLNILFFIPVLDGFFTKFSYGFRPYRSNFESFCMFNDHIAINFPDIYWVSFVKIFPLYVNSESFKFFLFNDNFNEFFFTSNHNSIKINKNSKFTNLSFCLAGFIFIKLF